MISVCIATYNGATYIGQQLASILKQLGPTDEIVISDDASTDATRDVVTAFGDARIRLVDGPATGSLIANFEHALTLAKGDVIFLADQDDVWMDNKVAVTMAYLKTCDCVVSDATVVDSHLNVIAPSFFALNGTRRGRLFNLIVRNGYLGCCMAFRRNVLEAVLPFKADIPMHDIWIGNVAAFRFRLRFVPEQLVMFRRHEGNNSTSARKSKYSLWKKFSFRYIVLKDLLS